MIAAVAGTQTVLWHLAADSRLTVGARNFIEAAADRGDRIGISVITFAEILCLDERQRIAAGWFEHLMGIVRDAQNVFVEVSLTGAVVSNLPQVPRQSVPDFPDRLIAATAKSLQVPVISRDRKIQASGLPAIW